MLLQRWLPRPSARLRLLCLPPAGGSAGMYRPWAAQSPTDVEVLAAELPGHGTRYGEQYVTSMAELADLVVAEAAGLGRRPIALFGHSMGGLLALEVGRRLRDRTGSPPAALLVSSMDAPTVGRADLPELTSLPDDHWRSRLVSLGALDRRTADDPAMMTMVMTMLRADLEVMSGYRHTARDPLGCPVRVYAGTDDRDVTERGLAGWRRECPTNFRISRLPGGHSFFRDDPAFFLARLHADIGVGQLESQPTAY